MIGKRGSDKSEKMSRKCVNGNINSSPEKSLMEKRKKKGNVKNLQINLNNKLDINSDCTDVLKNPGMIQDDSYYDDLDQYYSENDPSRPDGSLELKITNISKFKDMDFRSETKILSQEATIRCLPWKILFMLRIHQDRSQRCMGFFLQCNAKSDSTVWHCHTHAELRLVAQRRAILQQQQQQQPLPLSSSLPGSGGGGSDISGSGASVGNGAVGAATVAGSTTPVAVSCQDIVKQIEHNFFYRENDWGYSNFLSWVDLISPERGFVGADDSLLLRVKVQADAPHGVDWDSKRHTGFVGLKNQGATCYMNSLLQALFFTNKLRAAVYQLPTDTDDDQRSVSLALQRVFYELQFGDKAVGTKRLTKSFGWETLDTFMQHDAQELCRVLLDNLECKMKGTRVEDTIPNLFCGKMMSFIRCKTVPLESKREEAFYDIQLKVKGNSDIYQAFDEYIMMETLDGDNKYDAGEYGMQDAEKGIVFVKFPPVLYLQLMRFQYDYEADANIKINDRFEFHYSLDLAKYLQQPPAQDARSRYVLHTVLVHSGDNHGGHYVAYLNPRGRNEWYKFDDDVVSRCSRRDAILSNYGGNDEETSMKQCTNAYMLVYISETDLDDLLRPIDDDTDIPANLHQRFANEKHVEDQKRREKANAHLYSTAVVLLDEDFYGWQGYELFDVDKSSYSRRLRFPRKANPAETTQLIADFLREKTERVRLWCIVSRNSQIQLSPLESPETQKLVGDAGCSNGSSSGNNNVSSAVLMLWVQLLPADQPELSLPEWGSWHLVFCKLYEPGTAALHFLGWCPVRTGGPLRDLFSWVCERARLPLGTGLIIWEERERKTLVRLGNNHEPLVGCYHGLVLVFERISTSSSLFPGGDPQASLLQKPLNAADFLSDLQHRGPVEFVEKIGELTARHPDNTPNPIRVVLRLSERCRYIDIVKALVQHLPGTDLVRLQLFRAVPVSSPSGKTDGQQQQQHQQQQQQQQSHQQQQSFIPGDPIRTTFDGNLSDLLSPGPGSGLSSGIGHLNATLPRTGLAGAAGGGVGRHGNAVVVSRSSQTILLTPPSLVSPSPVSAAAPSLQQQQQHHQQQHQTPPLYRRLYFQQLKMSITEVETMLHFPCRLISSAPHHYQMTELNVSIARHATVAELLAETRKQARLSAGVSNCGNSGAEASVIDSQITTSPPVTANINKYRVFEVADHRIISQIQLSKRISDIELPSGRILQMEPMAADEESGACNGPELLVPVMHCQLDIPARPCFGLPFSVLVRELEPVAELRARLRTRLEPAASRDFDKWGVAVLASMNAAPASYLYSGPNDSSGDLVKLSLFEAGDSLLSPSQLCIDHKPPSVKRTRPMAAEKPIKIHN